MAPGEKDRDSGSIQVYQQKVLDGLAPDMSPGALRASVTSSVTAEFSDVLRYGRGEWDKVTFKVGTMSSVTLHCQETADGIRTAQNLAYDIAAIAAQEQLGDWLVRHTTDIQDKYCYRLFHTE